jgi:hypothetical protein
VLAKVERRLQNAELSFVRSLADSPRGDLEADEYRDEMLAMKWVVEEFVAGVGELSRDARPLESAWFNLSPVSGPIAKETQELIATSLEKADGQRTAIRDGFDLVASQQTTQLLQLQREEGLRNSKFERTVSTVASVLAGPALVTGIFDAIPALLPSCRWEALALMAICMAAAAAAGWLLLQRFGRPSHADSEERARQDSNL